MTNENKDLLPYATPVEASLEVAAVITSAVPWIGGPVSSVLNGVSYGRKIGRVKEALTGLAADLKNFKSEASEQYVKTEEFEELLEHTLRRVSEERNEEKRRVYQAFLSDAVKFPSKSYDEQMRFLRTLEEVQSDHFKVIRALNQSSSKDLGMMGSPIQTLKQRLPEMEPAHIQEIVSQLNDLRITNLTSMNTMMTGQGAENLAHSITPYGQRFLNFILEA